MSEDAWVDFKSLLVYLVRPLLQQRQRCLYLPLLAIKMTQKNDGEKIMVSKSY